MRRSAVDNEKDRALRPGDQALQTSMKTEALTPAPFSLIMNRMWPREVIAEIRLMPSRAPLDLITGVLLECRVRPAW